jgi:hypothetical protein
MKILTKIQIILTVLVVIAVAVDFKIALWLHSTAFDDPARQKWHPALDILWFGSVIPWLLFTICHIIFRLVKGADSPKTDV